MTDAEQRAQLTSRSFVPRQSTQSRACSPVRSTGGRPGLSLTTVAGDPGRCYCPNLVAFGLITVARLRQGPVDDSCRSAVYRNGVAVGCRWLRS